jgi:hypothetical protein
MSLSLAPQTGDVPEVSHPKCDHGKVQGAGGSSYSAAVTATPKGVQRCRALRLVRMRGRWCVVRGVA